MTKTKQSLDVPLPRRIRADKAFSEITKARSGSKRGSSGQTLAERIEGLNQWSANAKLTAVWAVLIATFQLSTVPKLILGVSLKWTDFQSFHRAGRWILGSQDSPLYPLTSFSGQTGPAADLHLCMNPPHFILALSPLSHLSMRTAYLVFAFINIGCLIATLLLLGGFTRQWRPGHRFCAVALIIGSPFLSAALSQGTVSIPITLCLVMVMRADIGGRSVCWRGAFGPGVCLGLISMKPQYLLLVGVYLVVRHQWKVLSIGMAATASWFGASVAVLGIDPWLQYPRYLQIFTQQLDTFDLNDRGSYWVAEQMINARGVLVRLLGFEQAALINLLSVAVLLLAVALTAAVGVRVSRGQLDPLRAWGLIALATVVASGHMNPPDGVTLIVPFFLGWSTLRSPQLRNTFALLIPALTVVPLTTFGGQNKGSMPLFGLALIGLLCGAVFSTRSRQSFTAAMVEPA